MRYTIPIIKIARFQDENIAVTNLVSYIEPVQQLINDNDDIKARMESFVELMKYR